jgi:hypothetical protein
MGYAGNYHSKWLEQQLQHPCSALGREVANILGYVGNGLYNAPINIEKIDWTHPYIIEVVWSSYMASWDFPVLTRLWVECTRRMVRVSVEGCAPRRLKLQFHKRHQRNGDVFERLPDVEELVAMVDAEWGRIRFSLP